MSTAMGVCGARGPLQKLHYWQVVFLFSRVQKALSFYLDETKAFRKYLGLYFFLARFAGKVENYIASSCMLLN